MVRTAHLAGNPSSYGQIQESNCLPANWGSIFSSTARFNSMLSGLVLAFGLSGFAMWKVPVVVIFRFLCFLEGMTSPVYK